MIGIWFYSQGYYKILKSQVNNLIGLKRRMGGIDCINTFNRLITIRIISKYKFRVLAPNLKKNHEYQHNYDAVSSLEYFFQKLSISMKNER